MTAEGRFAGFSVSARFDGDQAVLDVRGEVEHVTVPVFRPFLEAVIASGYPSALLDLSDMSSIDASGLATIVSAASTLVASGSRLTIRSSSTEVARALDLNRLSERLNLERPDRLGPEQVAPAFLSPTSSVPAEADPGTRVVTSIPANEDVVDAALGLVVALVRITVGGADGASVSLRRHGRLTTVAASDQTILDMDSEQYVAGEGPCIDASIAGRWFHAESLEAETRWPTFTPKARALGISAILSSPLLARDHPVGALNIYSRTATAFAAQEQELAGVLATEASIVLTAAGADLSDNQLAIRVQAALRIRETIAEAQGIIMEREDIGEKEAFDVLRRASLASGQPLREGARDVVDSTHREERDLHIRASEYRCG